MSQTPSQDLSETHNDQFMQKSSSNSDKNEVRSLFARTSLPDIKLCPPSMAAWADHILEPGARQNCQGDENSRSYLKFQTLNTGPGHLVVNSVARAAVT